MKFTPINTCTTSFCSELTNNATYKSLSTLQVPILHRAKSRLYGISSRTYHTNVNKWVVFSKYRLPNCFFAAPPIMACLYCKHLWL